MPAEQVTGPIAYHAEGLSGLHRGHTKDPGPDQFLVFDAYGHEVWQLQGADPEKPYVAPPRR